MYEPIFNSVLVEIDDKDAEWGSGNDDSMLGKSYSKGKVVRIAPYFVTTKEHPLPDGSLVYEDTDKLVGKNIMWNEGAEAGTVFEFDGKQFGMIYWFDIRGVKVEA